MPILLITLLILWPIAELAAMVGIAIWLGVLPMFGLLFLSTVAGLLVLRYRGEAHWRRFRGALSERRPPAREAFDGTMITSGALLLVLPGFISSLLGLLLLFPPTRYLIRIASITLFAGRFRWAAAGATWGGRTWESWRVRGQDFDIEGEAVEVRAEVIELEPATDREAGGPGPPLLPGEREREEPDDV
ncbi:MAG: FxsA family protein [Solirubrobacterales bacterium]|jgi:UPF0716 protein FxsA